MKFVCDRCQTRYSIADEKVRQKILRIRCKTCGNVIVVQGEEVAGSADASRDLPGLPRPAASAPATVPPPSRAIGVASPALPVPKPAAPAAARPSVAPAARSLPLPAPAKSAASPTPKPPSALSIKAGPAVPPPPPAASAEHGVAGGGRVEWYVAVGGVRSGPFSRVEASRKVLAADPDSVVHVWKDGMTGWKPAEEVSVIARELSALRTPPPPPPEPPKIAAPAAKASLPSPADKLAKAATPEPVFPGKPLDSLIDGTTERMDVDGADTSQFSEITTKKGNEIGALADESLKEGFSEITTKKTKNLAKEIARAAALPDPTTKKSKNLRDLDTESLFPAASPPVSSRTPAPSAATARQKTADVPAPALPTRQKTGDVSAPAPSTSATGLPVATPLPIFKPAAPAPAASVAAADLGGLAAVLRAVDVPEADDVVPQVFPDAPPPVSPALEDVPAEQKKARPGLKYLVAAGIIVLLVLLIVLVSFRMDSRKVPVEPDMPQTKAAAPDPKVAVNEPKPSETEPQAVLPVVDEKPTPSGHATTKRSATVKTTVKSVGPAPAPAPMPPLGGERPVPKLSGPKSGADARPNPFDEGKTVSQSQITSVVRNKNNQVALRACYERALKMDNHLTSGRIDVTVSIGTSGIVQSVVVNAPSAFIMVEPCIKQAVRRWVFPPSSEEYGTSFPLIMQGG